MSASSPTGQAVSTPNPVPAATKTSMLRAGTATSTPQPTDGNGPSSGGSDLLSEEVFAGIAVGAAVVLVIVFIAVVVMVVIMVRKRKKKDYTPPVEEEKENVAYGVAATGGSELENNLSYGAFGKFDSMTRKSCHVEFNCTSESEDLAMQKRLSSFTHS